VIVQAEHYQIDPGKILEAGKAKERGGKGDEGRHC
jgi:hypothetical protein